MTSIIPFEDYLQALEHLQTRLLSMPEEEALSDSFASEQNKLAELISTITQYPPDDQDKARIIMRAFAEKLNIKLEQLKLRMEHLNNGMDQHQNRMRGMRAYGQGKIF